MRISNFLSVAATCLMLLLGTTQSASGQLSDPIPAVIQPGISVGLELIAILPDTEGEVNDGRNTTTRINFFRETTDGRRFVCDQRGLLYELDSSGNNTVYAHLRNIFTDDIYTGSLASGFTSFDFHPDFANNGLFYTLHTETHIGTPTPDHIPATFNLNDVSYHAVVTEWNASTPSAGTFAGTRREVLRIGSTGNSALHPLGDVSFNPTAGIGDADYGILYIAGGDWALSGINRFDALQRTDTLAGTMLRIDPTPPTVSGGIAGLGDYTIPADNPYANDGDPNTLGEIFAYGFRNCHRISWDPNGNMFGMDIGLDNIEEVNLILAGKNYGWGEREGSFLNGQAVSGGEKSQVYTATNDPNFQDPVAQYDHDEGRAIAGGFAYSGTLVPELQGKFVFGDIVAGKLFYADLADLLAADDGDNSTMALIQELQIDIGGSIQTMQQITNTGRVDLRLGIDQAGEIYVLSKGDGSVRQFVTLIPTPSQWTLVDDFQGHTAGNAVEGVFGPGATWTGDGTGQHTAQVDPDCATNLAMQVSGAPGNAVLRAQFTAASTNIAAGNTGTLYYRFRTPVGASGTTDHVLGLTDNNAITNFNFKSGLRNTVPAGTNNMDVRNGGGYESVSSLADNTWYRVWMVSANTNPGTFELYLQSDTDTNFATQTKLSTATPLDVFDYRINGATDIVNVYFRNAANTGGVAGNDIYFDDIWVQSDTVDLTVPGVVVTLGDVNLDGVVSFLDISPFIAVLSTEGFQVEADCDCDGDVDFLDIAPFIAILSGQ